MSSPGPHDGDRQAGRASRLGGWLERQPRPAGANEKSRALLAGVSMATSVTFVAALAVMLVLPVPRHLRLSPGPSPDVGSLIKVEGAETYQSKSRVGLALVVVAPADNLFEVARGKLDRDSQVFRMEEVQFEIKQYYKVEVVGAGGPAAAASAPPVVAPVSEQYGEVASSVPPAPEASVIGPEPVAAPEGRPSFSIFTRS